MLVLVHAFKRMLLGGRKLAELMVLIVIIKLTVGFRIVEGTKGARVASFAHPGASQGERSSKA